jgi:phosphatidylglycerol:prolipoprotein diacylglycerol transferase
VRPLVLHWLEHHLRGDLASILAPSWFTCVGLAGLAGLALMLVLGRRRGIDAGAIASIVLWCYIAAVIAGIAVPALITGLESRIATGHFALRWSGMTSFWGYLAGAAAVTLVCERHGLPLARIADLAAIPMGVALVFARLGCFMAGCDYGKLSTLPWAVRFPAGSPAWRDHLHSGLIGAGSAWSLPVHPTQLYEALLGLVIVGVVLVAARRSRKDGDAFLLAAATYAIGRLAIETLRGDAGRGLYAGVSSGQIFSLLVLVAIAARVLVRRRMLAATAAAVVLSLVHLGEADAQPASADTEQPPELPRRADPPPAPVVIAAEQADPTERPLFATGAMFTIANSLNRRDRQVAPLSGLSLSIGYLPGRFGFWLDLDSISNSEARHNTALAGVSFTLRPTRNLMYGVRAGIGITGVDFRDSTFRDASGGSYRFDVITEYAFNRHWALWMRPLTIDTVSIAELGGPITTYQFSFGFAYRFGSRHNAAPPATIPQLPPLPPEQIGALP